MAKLWIDGKQRKPSHSLSRHHMVKLDVTDVSIILYLTQYTLTVHRGTFNKFLPPSPPSESWA